MSYLLPENGLNILTAEALGFQHYIGSCTGALFAVAENIHREFEPVSDDRAAMLVLDTLISRGFEVYLFYKQPTPDNVTMKRIRWICEIRKGGVVIAWAMSDDRGVAICRATVEALTPEVLLSH
jgi:hypothetical protein